MLRNRDQSLSQLELCPCFTPRPLTEPCCSSLFSTCRGWRKEGWRQGGSPALQLLPCQRANTTCCTVSLRKELLPRLWSLLPSHITQQLQGMSSPDQRCSDSDCSQLAAKEGCKAPWGSWELLTRSFMACFLSGNGAASTDISHHATNPQ